MGVTSVSAEPFVDLTLKLLQGGYHFTALDSDSVSAGVRLSECQVDKEPLLSLIEYLDSKTLNRQSVIFVAAWLIRAAWQQARIEESAHSVTNAVLCTLASKPEGRFIVEILRDNIEGIFSVDVINASKALQYIDVWISTNGDKLI